MAPLHKSRTLNRIARALGVVPIGFGINALLRPAHALSFFGFEPPTSPADRQIVDSLMMVYGVRDIFMGLALFLAAFLGSHRTLGWILVATSAVAVADGYVSWVNGQGPWSHLGYAPVLTALGVVFVKPL